MSALVRTTHICFVVVRHDTCKTRYHVCFLVCSGGKTVKNVWHLNFMSLVVQLRRFQWNVLHISIFLSYTVLYFTSYLTRSRSFTKVFIHFISFSLALFHSLSPCRLITLVLCHPMCILNSPKLFLTSISVVMETNRCVIFMSEIGLELAWLSWEQMLHTNSALSSLIWRYQGFGTHIWTHTSCCFRKAETQSNS